MRLTISIAGDLTHISRPHGCTVTPDATLTDFTAVSD
jgi:hypothetical protein